MFSAAFLVEGSAVAERAEQGQPVGVARNLEYNESHQRDQRKLHPLSLLGLLVSVSAINQSNNSSPAKQVVDHTQQQPADTVKRTRFLTQLPIACPAGESFGVFILLFFVLIHGGGGAIFFLTV